MNSKLVENKRRSHADKILQKMSKKVSEPTSKKDQSAKSSDTLRDQYDVIRKDLIKLREDLTKGYDMAKNLVEKKGLLNQLLKAR